MGLLKLPAILLFPIGLLSVLDATGVYSPGIGMDIALIGAVVMIVVQLITLFIVHKEYGHRFMNIVIFVVFVGTACYYIFSTLSGIGKWAPLELILGMMMFLEGMYAMP
jgi:hypothetical protein